MQVDSKTLNIIENDKLRYNTIMKKIGLRSESNLNQEGEDETVADDDKNDSRHLNSNPANLIDLNKMLFQKKKLQEEK